MPKARVACIGVAGERQCKMAAVMNDHGRAAGRTGMGAVMGAKNLKAIAVRGTAAVPVADAPALESIAGEIVSGTKDDMAALALQLAGTASYVDMALMYGDMPTRYYQQGEWEKCEQPLRRAHVRAVPEQAASVLPLSDRLRPGDKSPSIWPGTRGWPRV